MFDKVKNFVRKIFTISYRIYGIKRIPYKAVVVIYLLVFFYSLKYFMHLHENSVGDELFPFRITKIACSLVYFRKVTYRIRAADHRRLRDMASK